uniref:Cytosolic fatty-acid binding proteins domain-containing protein n=1 Tax=Branchiostoma floridae TaxID=7739 RepID=C4A0G6_BRAFL|eukprot:XP_002585697.1 hypothetical protein BRAFLDRAFT_73769 [Branchiostoma floridae]
MSPTERVDLSGTWKMVQVENFDAYLQALGIGFVLRAIAKMLSNTQIIEQDGDSFYVKDINTLQVTVTWDGDVLRGYTETDKGIIRTERYIREDGTMLYVSTL